MFTLKTDYLNHIQRFRGRYQNVNIADVGKHSVINQLYGAVVSLGLGLGRKKRLPWNNDLGFRRSLGNWHDAMTAKLK